MGTAKEELTVKQGEMETAVKESAGAGQADCGADVRSFRRPGSTDRGFCRGKNCWPIWKTDVKVFTEGVKAVLKKRDAVFPFIRGVVADLIRVDVEACAGD